MTTGIFELAIVIFVSALLGVTLRFLRQPTILAYLATGVFIAYAGFFHFEDKEVFRVFSDLGIMFLLFLVGMELNYASLVRVGKPALVIGIGQILFTFAFGWLIAVWFGFSALEASYIAIALTFSSTIVVVKLLSEKDALHSLYGRISIGFLLVQDFVAILILLALAGLQTPQEFSFGTIAVMVIKGIALLISILWLGRNVFPFLFDRIARAQELLFLTSLAWLFLLAALMSRIGFSIEIAGFLAGVALANSSERFQIASRVRPLRDFFILIFFVILGSSIVLSDFSGLAMPIVVFSLFVLIGNPLIVLAIMGVMGYRKRTGFMAGLTVAQISEFSFIVAAAGVAVGHLTESIAALVTAVGIVTITLSTYAIIHAEILYKKLSGTLVFFERKKLREEPLPEEAFAKPIVLIGFHRTGQSIALSLRREDLLVIDFDPEIIAKLKRHGIAHLFGNGADEEIFERVNFALARLVVSTSPSFEDNMALLERLNKLKERNNMKVIVRAETDAEARLLYEQGADYVLIPSLTSGHYLGKYIASNPELALQELKAHDLAMMSEEARRNN